MKGFIVYTEIGHLVNHHLTKRLFKLHSEGYDLDFYLLSNDSLICIQNQEHFSTTGAEVTLIDQTYDFISNTYKYVHTVDTACGAKGIMVMEGIYALNVRKNCA